MIFVVLIVGVLIGGAAAWLRQSKWRRSARRLEAEVRALHDEMETIRRRFGTGGRAAASRPSRTRCRSSRRRFLNGARRFRFAAGWRRR